MDYSARIQLALDGAEEVRSTLERLEEDIKDVTKRQTIRLQADEAKKEVTALNAEVRKLKNELSGIDKKSDSKKWSDTNNQLKEAQRNARLAATANDVLSKTVTKLNQVEREETATAKAQAKAKDEQAKATERQQKAEQREAKQAEDAAERIRRAEEKKAQAMERTRQKEEEQWRQAHSFQAYYRDASSKMAHFGSAMQSVGNALTQLTSPFKQITDGMLMGTGYKLLGKFTEGLENGFNRYDTMKKYPKLMAEFETKSYSAQQSINDLDKAVRGLPTSLNDMVDLSQRFTMTMGDMKRGTKLAIATNNAFLASMSTDTQKYQGMMQMQDVIGGKDMTAKEWQALAQSMKPAIRMMGQDMGKSGKKLNEWVSAVMQGEVSNEEFLEALEKTGTGMGRAAQAAQRSKDTWESFFANIGNASSRMTAGIITSLDEIVKTFHLVDKDGMAIDSVNLLLANKLTPAIDRMTESAKDWIKTHPEEITNFFKAFGEINWRQILSGFAEGLMLYAKALKWFAGLLDGNTLSKWFGRFMSFGNFIGKALTIGGGLLKGSRIPLGGLVAAVMSKFGGKGIFGKIKEFFLGKNASKTAKELAEAPKAADTLRRVFDGWSGALKVAGIIAIPAVTAMGVVKSLKTIMKDFSEIGSLADGINWDNVLTAVGVFGEFIGAFIMVSDWVGKLDTERMLQTLKGEAFIGAITAFAGAIADLDMFFLKDIFRQFRDLSEYLSESVENLNGLQDFDKDNAVERIGKVANAMAEVYSALKVTDEEGKSLMPASGAEVKAMDTVVGGMSSIIGHFTEISDTMKAVDKNGLINKDKAIEIGQKMGGILEGLGEAFHSYLETDFGYNPTDLTEGMADTIKNFNDALNTIIGKDGLIATMRKLVTQTADVPGVQSVGSVLGSVKRFLAGSDGKGGIFAELKEITKSSKDAGDAEQLYEKMHNFSKAFGSIRNIFTKMSEIDSIKPKTKGKKGTGDFSAIAMVKKLISQLKAAFGDYSGLDELSSQIQGFVDKVNNLMDAMTEINGEHEIDVSVKLGGGKVKGTDTVIKAVNNANKQIAAAVNKIRTTYTKHIWINVKSHVSSSGQVHYDPGTVGPFKPESATGGQISRNGVLYRSGGGSIFKSRGTDKIPAMLTAGEYVHKKQAVDFFGVDFMRKINNMDVRGAMDALLTKAGTSVGVGRQSIVNNTVNNNQRITQNISTNNPNFARARMGRFVGAL